MQDFSEPKNATRGLLARLHHRAPKCYRSLQLAFRFPFFYWPPSALLDFCCFCTDMSCNHENVLKRLVCHGLQEPATRFKVAYGPVATRTVARCQYFVQSPLPTSAERPPLVVQASRIRPLMTAVMSTGICLFYTIEMHTRGGAHGDDLGKGSPQHRWCLDRIFGSVGQSWPSWAGTPAAHLLPPAQLPAFSEGQPFWLPDFPSSALAFRLP